MQQAQDTFVAQMADGSQVRVTKGEFLPEGHELVKRDQAGSGLLFRQVYLAEDEQPKAKPSGRAAKLWRRHRRAITCGNPRRR